MIIFTIYCLNVWRGLADRLKREQHDRLQAEAHVERMSRELSEQRAFLAAIGHDLRTPIGAILTGAAEMRDSGDSQVRVNAELIADAGLMMKALLDDLLDHSKLGAGRMSVEVADFDLRAMLAQTLRLWKGAALAKGLNLRIEGESKKPRLLRLWAPITVSGPLTAPKVGVDVGSVVSQGGLAGLLGAVVAPVTALFAFVDPGLAEDADCGRLIANAR